MQLPLRKFPIGIPIGKIPIWSWLDIFVKICSKIVHLQNWKIPWNFLKAFMKKICELIFLQNFILWMSELEITADHQSMIGKKLFMICGKTGFSTRESYRQETLFQAWNMFIWEIKSLAHYINLKTMMTMNYCLGVSDSWYRKHPTSYWPTG